MPADIFDTLDNQSPLGFFADVVQQLCDRGEVTTWENIVVYKAVWEVSWSATEIFSKQSYKLTLRSWSKPHVGLLAS